VDGGECGANIDCCMLMCALAQIVGICLFAFYAILLMLLLCYLTLFFCGCLPKGLDYYTT